MTTEGLFPLARPGARPDTRRRWGQLKTASGLCFGMLLSACGGMTAQNINSELEAELPAELREDYKSFTQNCAKCHGLERALNAHVTDVRHWDLYVAKMMRTAGSAISRSESPKILRFLYWYTERENRRSDSSAKSSKYTLKPLTEAEANQPAVPSPAPAPPAATPATEIDNSAVTTPRSESIQGETAP